MRSYNSGHGPVGGCPGTAIYSRPAKNVGVFLQCLKDCPLLSSNSCHEDCQAECLRVIQCLDLTSGLESTLLSRILEDTG